MSVWIKFWNVRRINFLRMLYTSSLRWQCNIEIYIEPYLIRGMLLGQKYIFNTHREHYGRSLKFCDKIYKLLIWTDFSKVSATSEHNQQQKILPSTGDKRVRDFPPLTSRPWQCNRRILTSKRAKIGNRCRMISKRIQTRWKLAKTQIKQWVHTSGYKKK